MYSLSHIDGAMPPRLVRSVCLQALALAGIAFLAGRPWALAEPRPAPVPTPPPPQKQERRIRVVRLPPLPQVRQVADAPHVPEHTEPPPNSPPAPPRAAPAPPKLAARPSPVPPTRIAADSTAVHGVRLRVMVPRSAADLASHLRHSGGCLVVSRLSGGSAEVLSVLAADGHEIPGPPCDGVPRVLRDSRLNDALGDPLGRARAGSPGELVLQVLISPGLEEIAQSTLRARFGPVSQEEMGRLAAASGYELTCFADPAGPLRCQ
jgi:hypothetical protein